MQETTRIAVIGAGASGLAQLKQLLDAFARRGVQRRLEVVVYESRAEIGGVWTLSDAPKRYHQAQTRSPPRNVTAQADPDGARGVEQMHFFPPAGDDPSPMYEGLRTNLTYDLMGFRDLPFPGNTARCEDPDQLFIYPRKVEDPSPMYDGLRTIPASDVMSFRDLSFPEGTSLFPDRATVLRYLQLYARKFGLLQHIRFGRRVNRLHHTPSPPAPSATSSRSFATSATSSPRRWTIESSALDGNSAERETFDCVTVANGHYSDGWIPEIPGLASFPGQVLHSRFYRRPSDFAGQSVLVVGSFASGSDLSRQLASLNLGHYDPSGEPLIPDSGEPYYSPGGIPNPALSEIPPFTKTYVSSSNSIQPPPPTDAPPRPWQRYITHVPLISHIAPEGVIHFLAPSDCLPPPEPVHGVDTIIFATGYNFALPFCKTSDEPWTHTRVLDRAIQAEEREGGDEREQGGMKGLTMKNLDELVLFLQGDRTIAFPVLQYQVVPFPLAETQARLTSLLWAGLLPSFPDHPRPPPNPSNPYHTPSSLPLPPSSRLPEPAVPHRMTERPRDSNGDTGPSTHAVIRHSPTSEDESSTSKRKGNGTDDPPKAPVRKVLAMRQKLVFGPYEYPYQEYLMELMSEADGERGTPECWKAIEGWRRARREDTGLRLRTLGY